MLKNAIKARNACNANDMYFKARPEAQLSQRDRAKSCRWIFRLITQGNSRSFEIVQFESLGTVSDSHFIATIAVCLAVCEISSVKEWRDLEIWVLSRPGSLKIAPFDIAYTTFYWSAIVHVSIALSCTIFELFDVE